MRMPLGEPMVEEGRQGTSGGGELWRRKGSPSRYARRPHRHSNYSPSLACVPRPHAQPRQNPPGRRSPERRGSNALGPRRALSAQQGPRRAGGRTCGCGAPTRSNLSPARCWMKGMSPSFLRSQSVILTPVLPARPVRPARRGRQGGVIGGLDCGARLAGCPMCRRRGQGSEEWGRGIAGDALKPSPGCPA